MDYMLMFSLFGAHGMPPTPATSVAMEEQASSPRSRKNTRTFSAILESPNHFGLWVQVLSRYVLKRFTRRSSAEAQSNPNGELPRLPLSLQLRFENWLAVVLMEQSFADALCDSAYAGT